MGVTREQIQEGGRVYFRMEVPRPGGEPMAVLKAAKVLEVDRAAALIRLEDNGFRTKVRFCHLEPDPAYLEQTRRKRAKYPNPDNVIVTSRFVRPAANGNALREAPPPEPPPPQPAAQPPKSKTSDEEFRALNELAGPLVESIEADMRKCEVERETLLRQLDENLKRQDELEARKERLRRLLGAA